MKNLMATEGMEVKVSEHLEKIKKQKVADSKRYFDDLIKKEEVRHQEELNRIEKERLQEIFNIGYWKAMEEARAMKGLPSRAESEEDK